MTKPRCTSNAYAYANACPPKCKKVMLKQMHKQTDKQTNICSSVVTTHRSLSREHRRVVKSK